MESMDIKILDLYYGHPITIQNNEFYALSHIPEFERHCELDKKNALT